MSKLDEYEKIESTNINFKNDRRENI